MRPFASAFWPMRIVAEATIAITAGASPASVADTQVTSPCATYTHDSASNTKKLGSTNITPATRPPRTLCRSQPR